MATADGVPVELNTSVPHIARIYDYWLGGKDNFAVDREAAERALAIMPNLAGKARANRAFLGRAVHHLAAEAGIRQFLDIGTGLPAADNTHEVAQRVAPDSRIVYVDNDPVVLVHAQAMLTGTREGATAYIDADARNIDEIVDRAAATLDFSRPVAVMLVAILHCIPDEDEPLRIVTALREAVPPGSHLVLSHPTMDLDPQGMAEVAATLNRVMPTKVTYRSYAQVERFFDGWEPLEPGIVPAASWRPRHPHSIEPKAMWAGVARKP
ncbi:MAG TPA: SAM-dependent methyltransferase [Streptosporangiaceae bacterium]|nr:SAM-dependent methyltransferase [Streptosporangiaceae bacterium]